MTNAVRESAENPECPRAPEDLIRDLRAEIAALAAARLALQRQVSELVPRVTLAEWQHGEERARADAAEAELTQLREALGALVKWVEASDCCYGGSCIADEVEHRVCAILAREEQG